MMGRSGSSLIVWAAKELRRHPATTLLTGLVIAAAVATTATVLLLVESWSATSTALLGEGPSLVVRRVDSGGWRPLPQDEAVAAATAVVGVTAARPRVWGVVTGPAGAITVQGVTETAASGLTAAGIKPPAPGQAVVGAGVGIESGQSNLTLVGAESKTYTVTNIVTEAAPALHDVVLLTLADARSVLGLEPGQASDLAVDVYHAAEETAILPDLSRAFPWPVRITTRTEAVGATIATVARRGGLAIMLLVPAILALVLLVATGLRPRSGTRRELGLAKALGWTTGDLVTLQLWRSLAVGVPATLLGLAIAGALVFWPGITWPGRLILGWRSAPPPLSLAPQGMVIVALGVAALVLVPWLLASLVPAVRTAAADPDDLIRGGE